jgi:ABC-type branched-subunit amino acid transport system substrate-binding protein
MKVTAAFVIGGLVGAFSSVQVAARLDTTTVALSGPGGTVATNGAASRAPGAPRARGGSGQVASGPIATAPADEASGLACEPGRNGGATDVGVTGDSIALATTVVQSGIGAAFLGDVKYAMEAVRNRVNREGGICGRQLQIRYVDDGWEASRGAQFLRNFIKEGVFAIPVGPSSEGLNVVIKSGDVRRAGIPVVGTDGMLIDQYTDPWVWSVAVATASSARIMARNAYARGARTFSIVFDKNYRFGVEAAEAYNNEVTRLTGHGVEGYNSDHNCQGSFCGILAGQSSYATEINQFQPGDFVAMFLEPTTALTWMATPGAPRAVGRNSTTTGVGLAQPLFTRDFATNCQQACDQMWVWTSYKPPIEDYANDPLVRAYVDDLKKTKPDADEYNAFAEGGYVGMALLVDAMKRVGPNLTRAALLGELELLKYASGLTLQRQLVWGVGDHFANATMQAFAIQYKGTFSGWRAQQIERDPHPELGIG